MRLARPALVGLTALALAGGPALAAASPAAPGRCRPGRSTARQQPSAPDGHRPPAATRPGRGRQGRRGVVGRPGRDPGRPAGAARRRQRRRRSGGDRGRARCDRAVQRRARWRRLLRALPGEHRRDRGPGRARDRAGGDATQRLHRPRHRRPVPVLPRPGHQRRLGRRARHPQAVGEGARPVRHLQPARRARRPRPSWPTGASWSTRRSDLQTEENAERFDAIRPTRRLFLPGGEAPEVGSVFRNPQLARTYRMLGKHGMDMFYRGPIAEQIARVAQDPPTTPGTDLPVPAGFMEESDLARLPGAAPGRHRGALPRPAGAGHAAVELRRVDGR